MGAIFEYKLNKKGKCCGKKPLVYKRIPHRGYYCSCCNRQYDLDTKVQIENWAWKKMEDGNFIRN